MNICAESFVENLKSKNLEFNVKEFSNGDVGVKFPYKGKETTCVFADDDGHYLSLYMIYERISEDKFAEALVACNDLNRQYKWVSYYIDDDNDIVIKNNAILTPETAGEVAFELLVRMITIADEAKPTLMKAIYA